MSLGPVWCGGAPSVRPLWRESPSHSEGITSWTLLVYSCDDSSAWASSINGTRRGLPGWWVEHEEFRASAPEGEGRPSERGSTSGRVAGRIVTKSTGRCPSGDSTGGRWPVCTDGRGCERRRPPTRPPSLGTQPLGATGGGHVTRAGGEGGVATCYLFVARLAGTVMVDLRGARAG